MSPSEMPPVPVGIQRLLRLAAQDEAFRARLFELRDAVATDVGVELTATERAVLRAASREQLEAMATHLPAQARSRGERLRATAATAAALLAAPGLLACDGCAQSAGARPDWPPPENSSTPASTAPATPFAEPPSEPTTSDAPATSAEPPTAPTTSEDAGVEAVPVAPKHNPMQSKGGAAPDEPPPPPPGPKTRGISPDMP